MAAPNTNKVAVGAAKVTGAIFVAPVSVDLPTNGTSTLTSDYKCLGYTSDDGLTITEDSSNSSLRAWEGRTEVRNTRTEYTEQITFTPVECNAEVAEFMWGADHVTVDSQTGAIKVEHHGESMTPVHVVIETVPYAGAVARYCAKAQLTERGDANLNGQDFSGREATMNCLGVNGVTMTEYIAAVDEATTTTTTGN